MEISHKNKLVRYAYSLPNDYVPYGDHISLCDFFWRLVFITMIWFSCAVVAATVLWIGYDITRPYPGLIYVPLLVAVILSYLIKWSLELCNVSPQEYIHRVSKSICYYEPTIIGKMIERVERSLFWKIVKAIKTKACPIIRIV